jgi:hypothetical protein
MPLRHLVHPKCYGAGSTRRHFRLRIDLHVMPATSRTPGRIYRWRRMRRSRAPSNWRARLDAAKRWSCRAGRAPPRRQLPIFAAVWPVRFRCRVRRLHAMIWGARIERSTLFRRFVVMECLKMAMALQERGSSLKDSSSWGVCVRLNFACPIRIIRHKQSAHSFLGDGGCRRFLCAAGVYAFGATVTSVPACPFRDSISRLS